MQLKLVTNSVVWVVSLFSLLLIGLALFAVQSTLRGGHQRSRRVEKAGGSVLLNHWLMEYGYWWLNPPARILMSLRITPDAVSLGGLVIVLLGSVALGFGYFGLAGPLILIGSLSDMLDGII